jgi:hypothetical protein
MRSRELIFHTGDGAGEELMIEVDAKGVIEAVIVSEEQPQARTVELDREQVEQLRDALTELLNQSNPSQKNTQQPCDICSGYGCPECRDDLSGGTR